MPKARLRARAVVLAGLLGLLVGAAPAPAPAATAHPPMQLGAASNFSQGWSAATHAAALALPVAHFRDGMPWREIEQHPGLYRFDRPRAAFPARLAERGGDLVFTVAGANPLFDHGDTPYSSAGIAALARYVAAVLERYPAITVVEVGNEFNGPDFVRGPVRTAGLAARRQYHLAQVQAVARAARAVRPGIIVLGGATHSLPAGYLWPLLDQGARQWLDGLAVHPYTTPIDQLAAEIGVLRRHPAARNLPLWVTEFGSPDEAMAPDHLVRGFAALAALGVHALYWYPLNPRGDGMAALLDRAGRPTPAGEAFRFVSRHLAGRPARDVSPDPFTKAVAFGDRALVLWGEPRSVRLAPGQALAAHDARGHPLDTARLMLAPDRALVVLAPAGRRIALGEEVLLGCSDLVADSFYQFAFPMGEAGPPARPDAGPPRFVPSVIEGEVEQAWQTRPGQQTPGVPWVPYLGLADRPLPRLTASRMLLPAPSRPVSIVHRIAPGQAGPWLLEVEAAPAAPAPVPEAAFALRIHKGDQLLWQGQGQGRLAHAARLDARPGESVSITLSRLPGRQAGGLALDYRLRLRQPSRCAD